MLTEQEKQIVEEASLENEEGVRRATEREIKRRFDKSLGKESFSDKLKRQMKEKRLKQH